MLQTVVTDYTREAGVRQLERELGHGAAQDGDPDRVGKVEAPVTVDEALVRDALGRQKFWQEAAERTAVPGVATGLAVTGAGGDVLFVEATRMEGKDGLTLTGQLGDVMKESAQIALSYVRGHAEELGIDEHAFENARVPRPRARGSDPEGRAVRGRHDDDRAGLAPERPAGEAHGGDDR